MPKKVKKGRVPMRVLPVPKELSHYKPTVAMEGKVLSNVRLMTPNERYNQMRHTVLPVVLKFKNGQQILCFISEVNL